jgi:hypothetical protein
MTKPEDSSNSNHQGQSRPQQLHSIYIRIHVNTSIYPFIYLEWHERQTEQTNTENLYNDIEAPVDHPTVCGNDGVIVVVVVLLLGWHTVYYYCYHDCHYCF